VGGELASEKNIQYTESEQPAREQGDFHLHVGPQKTQLEHSHA